MSENKKVNKDFNIQSYPLTESDLANLLNQSEEIDYDVFTDEKSRNKEGAKLFEEAINSYSFVDGYIGKFIANFVENQNKTTKQKYFLKYIFFVLIMLIFIIVVCTPLIVMNMLCSMNIENSVAILTAIIATSAEVLAAIIVLPKIVAEYLFNKEEEEANVKIVELMQNYSKTIHDYDGDYKE